MVSWADHSLPPMEGSLREPDGAGNSWLHPACSGSIDRVLSIPKGLPIYEAESSKWSPAQFVDEFNLVCDAVNFPAERRPTVFVTQLKGSARQWGKMVIINDGYDWPRTQRAFLNRFTRTQDEYMIREKLFTIRQCGN